MPILSYQCYYPSVLKLVQDGVIAGHEGKERTLTAARLSYFWPTMRIDFESYISKYVKCAQIKGVVAQPAPVLEYPPPDLPWDVVSIDLLQLPVVYQDPKHLLVSIDHLSRYVALVFHALVILLCYAYTAPRDLLSENRTEFRNHLLEEISKYFGVNHCFSVSYHYTSCGLLLGANRKIL